MTESRDPRLEAMLRRRASRHAPIGLKEAIMTGIADTSPRAPRRLVPVVVPIDRRLLWAAATVALLAALAISVIAGSDQLRRLAVAPPAPTPSPTPSDLMTPAARTLLFETVWLTIDDRYADPARKGIDWAAVKEEFAPRVAAASTAGEMDALMEEMVGRLSDCGTWYVSPADRAAESDPGTYVGVGVIPDLAPEQRPTEGLGLLYVHPGSPADLNGLQARDRILAIDGQAPGAGEALGGELGTTVELVVRSPGGASRTVTVTRGIVTPSQVPEARILPGAGRIGYLRLPFLGMPDAWLSSYSALKDLVDGGALDGLVLDLRGTLGGQLDEKGFVAQFTDRPFLLMPMDDGSTKPYHVPAGRLFPALADVPVAVLIDRSTSESAEGIASELDGIDRAVMVGAATNGCLRTTSGFDMPNGGVLVISVEDWLRPDGTPLGVTPVQPDVPLDGDWLAQPADQDSWIAAAASVLRDGDAGAASTPASGTTASPGA